MAEKALVYGKVGLPGEIHPVPNGEDRLKEAAMHGFKRAIVPKANAPKRPSAQAPKRPSAQAPKRGQFGALEIIAVDRLMGALQAAF